MSTNKFPRVGIGILILKNNNMLLLGKRINAHGAGKWQSSGGHLEFGESFEQAVEREIAEEIGIGVKNIKFLTVTNDVFENEDKHYVTIFMTCEYESGEPQILEPDKCQEWKWFKYDELPKDLFLPYDRLLKLRK